MLARMGKRLARIAAALWPFAGLALFVWLAVTGQLDLGGGEKDLVWGIPLAAYCLLYAAAFWVLQRRGLSIMISIAYALVAAATLLVLIGLAIGPDQLGIAW